MANEVFIGSTPVIDIYSSGTIVQEVWSGSTQVYGRTIVNTASPMVYNTDCTLLLNNVYKRLSDTGTSTITSAGTGVKFQISGGNYKYGGYGCQLAMANPTVQGQAWLSDGVFTATIEMGAYVNMASVKLFAMANSQYPTVAEGVALTANSVNTVLVRSDPGAGSWEGVFFIGGERATDATWSFIVKDAVIVSGDWT